MISENHDDQQKETSELLNALGLLFDALPS